jgi:hypothetical protein
VYSDAKEQKVLKTLEELEKFRVLIENGLNVKVPDTAPKTVIFLFKSKSQFRKFAYSSQLVGYVTSLDDVPLIVMPISSRNSDVGTVIKHELVHVVMGYAPVKSPRWYEEGLAEMFSTAEYREDLGFGMIGTPNWGRWEFLSREINYNEIIKDEFDGLKRRIGADAYAQYWILVNYSLTHNKGQYRKNLDHYLKLYHLGVDSNEAFETAYGMTANELAKEARANYKRRSYSYQRIPIAFEQEDMDMEVETLKPEEGVMARLMKRLEIKVRKIRESRK